MDGRRTNIAPRLSLVEHSCDFEIHHRTVPEDSTNAEKDHLCLSVGGSLGSGRISKQDKILAETGASKSCYLCYTTPGDLIEAEIEEVCKLLNRLQAADSAC